MNIKDIENTVNHITALQERFCCAENNLQYIKRLQALKHWLHKFDSLLDRVSRQQGEYAAIYESYFHTCCGIRRKTVLESTIYYKDIQFYDWMPL